MMGIYIFGLAVFFIALIIIEGIVTQYHGDK